MSYKYSEEEILKLDRTLRGKTYMNNKSKNRFFLHCVVSDAETDEVHVVLSNVYTGKMNSFKLSSFEQMVVINNKSVKRFEEEVKPEESTIKFKPEQPEPTQRIHEYDRKTFK